MDKDQAYGQVSEAIFNYLALFDPDERLDYDDFGDIVGDVVDVMIEKSYEIESQAQ